MSQWVAKRDAAKEELERLLATAVEPIAPPLSEYHDRSTAVLAFKSTASVVPAALPDLHVPLLARLVQDRWEAVPREGWP